MLKRKGHHNISLQFGKYCYFYLHYELVGSGNAGNTFGK